MKRVLITLVLLFATVPAGAQESAERDASRRLAMEGIQALRDGHPEEARELLQRAHELYQAPTIALWSAKALEACGQWVEALERYRAAARLDDPSELGQAQKQAQEGARAEAAEAARQLEPRVPILIIAVEGVPANGVSVELDGAEVPSAMLGIERRANPGERTVSGKLLAPGEGSAAEVTEQVVLEEGERKMVTLRFDAAASTRGEDPGVQGSGNGAPDVGLEPKPDRTAAWVALSVGAAGVLTGSVAGVLAATTKSDLSDQCPGDVCDDDARGDYDRFVALRTVSTTGFVIGAVGLSAGAALWLVGPKKQHAGLCLDGAGLHWKGRF